MADDLTFVPPSLAALAPKPTSSAAPVAVCTWVLGGAGGWECPLPQQGEGREERKPRGAELQRPGFWLLCLCVQDSRGMNLPWSEPHRASALLKISREESGPCYWHRDV